MKKVGFLAASVAVASATVVSGSSSSSTTSGFSCSSNFQFSRQENLPDTRDPKPGYSSSMGSVSTNRFEPQFDGLRFIETLVTAHR
ncbi:hypothetical protein SAY86_019103 [Trapa natans]|uniref:Uncharacterized protein n=1 Tax=Trapa natans TaxID=22666 RepID=A0AAN7LNZ7_TRANT|nr:hypothetical protein SAY86_019103 [Trapa natans]